MLEELLGVILPNIKDSRLQGLPDPFNRLGLGRRHEGDLSGAPAGPLTRGVDPSFQAGKPVGDHFFRISASGSVDKPRGGCYNFS